LIESVICSFDEVGRRSVSIGDDAGIPDADRDEFSIGMFHA
jgi:hypothetical protein